MFEFHIARQARDHYQFDQSLFSFNGNVIFANFHAARVFAQKMNQKRDLLNFPEQAVRASQINAMGLVDEILHFVVHQYRRQVVPAVMHEALAYLQERLGEDEVAKTLNQFATQFPPLSVYRKEQTLAEYLAGSTEGLTHAEITLEEMLLLWVSNRNPALNPYNELFSEDTLVKETAYSRLVQELYNFFKTQPPFGPDRQNLIDLLRAPALAHPFSLTDQLEFMREKWAESLGRYLYRLLSSLDFIKEEDKMPWTGAPGPVPIPVYDEEGRLAAGGEVEAFSPDREWMPRLVLMAKNTFVWLDQLSKQYDRPIHRLDQIPDEELDLLARRGFTGLWLIGLWERSLASARIKQLCGNPDAIASAYSLDSYNIAWELGGDEAYRNLRDRAGQRGIRLASDMVPNHMGIDSPWVAEHPEWFLSLDYSPYPAYSFNGPNLSKDGRVGIYLEDHYFDRTDAAVVFKRVDHSNGATQYIYHGNDGTSMPWNDTAQLNYLNPQVREVVIQTILEVARKFPIIRFDAAMTLAKKHIQRLWFPEPGSGGAIASRAEHAISRERFDELIPVEFWREVVDRVAAEVPDTLLLAEAFWMMEGYFVRTLGMHRVYNSAFMVLLRNEDNAKYRQIMKNTLEFDPEIIKRWVNFMNNPDERTAVDQFGNGDKYFGICTLMATMPGLPMFGHAQIEGFSEKYGMEFRRALWDEQPDPYLIERHEREIFPLFHRRAQFAGIEHFLLYDFFTPEGSVNEDVFAYSNGLGDERNLVIYHNRFGSTRGWVRTSAAFAQRTGDNYKVLTQKSLADGLRLRGDENTFTIFRDQSSGLEFIRSTAELIERGMYVELNAYKVFVFVDFRLVQDDAYHSYRRLCDYLGGRGVPSVQDAMQELFLQPVQRPFREMANTGYFRYLLDNRLTDKNTRLPAGLLTEAEAKLTALLNGVETLHGALLDAAGVRADILARLQAVLSLPALTRVYPLPGSRRYTAGAQMIAVDFQDHPERWFTLLAWVFTHRLGGLLDKEDAAGRSLSLLDEWQLLRLLTAVGREIGLSAEQIDQQSAVLRLVIAQQDWFTRMGAQPVDRMLETWLSDAAVQRFLGVNRFQGILWYNREAFETLVTWMNVLAVLETCDRRGIGAASLAERIIQCQEMNLHLLTAAAGSQYQVEKLLAGVKASLRAATPTPKAKPAPARKGPAKPVK